MLVGFTVGDACGDGRVVFRFSGSSQALTAMLQALNDAGLAFQVHADPDPAWHLLRVLEKNGPIPTRENWSAWNRDGHTGMYAKALASGARWVFSDPLAVPDLIDALQGLAPDGPIPERADPLREIRQYHRGERLFIEQESVVEISRGIVRCTTLHSDGHEVVTGFFGPGDFLFSHHAAHCHSEMTAHTPLAVSLLPWKTVVSVPHFHARLRDRLCFMEAWSAMQARPAMLDRLLGILEVLASRFSVVQHGERVFRIKITHEQLASAIGANRTTVTRLLGDLRKSGRLATRKTAGGEFYVMKQRTPDVDADAG
ncbi:Crp/Fnr family transcriptional regulator [Sulfidibacter corallicola]|uniref:Crp/Fnr family transcriptional regulator n=1 Tax=Sulfidibacter corallicola TaxID=2818388 RepID=A0A8A4TJM9_SULCO|nr:Crp/Fnr family transcriptional regulator [Sulfidibacter corallicola]QTD49793.1 Crp/Fnr family transcriptional regulator [Sulfidibacter corallicola]